MLYVCLLFVVVFFFGGGGLEPLGFCFAYKSPTDTSKHELFSPDGKKKCYSEILQKKSKKYQLRSAQTVSTRS